MKTNSNELPKISNKTGNKAIIFDASTLISLSMNGLFHELRALKEVFNGKFLITQDVKIEVVEKPIQRKRFELEALRFRQLIEDKVFELPSSIGIDEKKLSERTKVFVDTANGIFRGDHKEMHIIDAGEASCLALSEELTKKGIQNVLAIDERTMRILIENPQNLNELLKRKLHINVRVNKNEFQIFKGFKVIRSSELVYILHKKNLTKVRDGKLLLDALLWAVKLKGCAISDEEIKEIKKMG